MGLVCDRRSGDPTELLIHAFQCVPLARCLDRLRLQLVAAFCIRDHSFDVSRRFRCVPVLKHEAVAIMLDGLSDRGDVGYEDQQPGTHVLDDRQGKGFASSRVEGERG